MLLCEQAKNLRAGKSGSSSADATAHSGMKIGCVYASEVRRRRRLENGNEGEEEEKEGEKRRRRR